MSHEMSDSRRGPQHITTLLREGADPALPSPAGETPLQISALTDPGRGALPENKAMTKLLEQALKPWHQKRHRLFPRTFTPRVVVVLLLQQRLERYAALWARQEDAWRATERGRRLGASLALRLTREEWLMVVPFLPRFGQVGVDE